MTHPSFPDPRSREVQQRRISRIPAFTPVPVRARRDGWTPLKQAEFIGMLAETRCVKRAAAHVGMSRESAYRLRRRRGAASFRAAWDSILGPPGTIHAPSKVTLDPLFQRIRHGTLRPVMRAGRYVGTVRKPDTSAIRSALSRVDSTLARRGAAQRKPKGHGKEKPPSV